MFDNLSLVKHSGEDENWVTARVSGHCASGLSAFPIHQPLVNEMKVNFFLFIYFSEILLLTEYLFVC